MFFLLYKYNDDGVFDDFPKISDQFLVCCVTVFAIQIGSHVAEPDTFTQDIVSTNCKQDDLKQSAV